MKSSIETSSSVQPDSKLDVSGGTTNPRGWERFTFLSWRRWLLIVSAASVLLTSSWYAWKQEPWPDVDHPPSGMVAWLYPWESNPELRLPLLAGDLTAIAESPQGKVVCAVGVGGLIYVSEDRGKSWHSRAFPINEWPFSKVQDVAPGASPPPPAKAADGKPVATEARGFVHVLSREMPNWGMTPVVFQQGTSSDSSDTSSRELKGPSAESGTPVTEDTEKRWGAAVINAAPTLFDVKFLDEQKGWIVGDGAILATVDGAKTWQLVVPRLTETEANAEADTKNAGDSQSESKSVPSSKSDGASLRIKFIGLDVPAGLKNAGAIAIGNATTARAGAIHGTLARLEFDGAGRPSATLVPQSSFRSLGEISDLVFDAIGRNPEDARMISAHGAWRGGEQEALIVVVENPDGAWDVRSLKSPSGARTVERNLPTDGRNLSTPQWVRWLREWVVADRNLWGLGGIAFEGESSSAKPALFVGLLGVDQDRVRDQVVMSSFANVTDSTMWGVVAVDSKTVIVVGDHGAILRGSLQERTCTWRVVSGVDKTLAGTGNPETVATSSSTSPKENYSAVSVGFDNRLWIAGSAGAVLSSDDLGENWVRRTRTEPNDSLVKRYAWWVAPWYYGAALVAAGLLLVALRPMRVAERPSTASQANEVSDILVSDRPVRDGDADSLNFGPLVRSIVAFLTNRRTQPPLTLAIEGEWGSGKSSLMNMVTAGLEQMGHRCIWFNAWHHQSCDHLLAALLQAIRDQAAPPVWHSHFLPCRLKILRRRLGTWRVMLPLLVFLALVSYMATVGLPDFSWILRASLKKANGGEDGLGSASEFLGTLLKHLGIGGGAIGSLWLFLFRSLSAFVAKPATLFAAGDSSGRERDSRISFRYQFAKEFREFTEALEPYRLVLFIDDLDRCQTDQVLEMLEAVNFLVTSGDCIVVMGMDKRRILKCVGRRFLELEGGGDAGEQVVGPAAWPAHVELRATGGKPDSLTADDETTNGAEASIDHLDPKAARYAIKYLEKVVNIWVQVPRPAESAWGRLVEDSLSAASDKERRRAARRAAEGKAIAVERGVKRVVSGLALGVCLAVAIVAGCGLAREVTLQREMLKREASELDGKEKESQRRAELERRDREATEARAYWNAAAAAFGFDRIRPIGPANVALESPNDPATASQDAAGLPALNPRLRHDDLNLPSASLRLPWEVMAMVAAWVLAGVYGLSTMVVLAKPTTDDSATFQTALQEHLHLITAKKSTPRAIKQYLNRLRYLASLQEPPSDLPHPPFRRWLMSFWDRDQGTAVASSETGGGIPAKQLVTLSVLELYDKDRLANFKPGRLDVSQWNPAPNVDDVRFLNKSVSTADFAEMAARYCQLTNDADLKPRVVPPAPGGGRPRPSA